MVTQAVEELEARAAADVKQKAASKEMSQQLEAKTTEVAELRTQLVRLFYCRVNEILLVA